MIYVASSWRNAIQPTVVAALRELGHKVYDFRNPAPGNSGFSWSQIDHNWEKWTPEEYRAALQHPIAKAGYSFDIEALRACSACVLVLPSGRSASWEFGYAMGQGKRGVVAQFDKMEPELMYREAEFAASLDELTALFCTPESALSEVERDVLRHALGWPRCDRRGHFDADPGSVDFAACESLVLRGLMRRQDLSWCGGAMFFVTPAGRARLIADNDKQP